jgi:hypothetical protein
MPGCPPVRCVEPGVGKASEASPVNLSTLTTTSPAPLCWSPAPGQGYLAGGRSGLSFQTRLLESDQVAMGRVAIRCPNRPASTGGLECSRFWPRSARSWRSCTRAA